MHGSNRRWLPWLLAVVLAAGVGIAAYNLGVAQGLAAVPPSGVTAPYGWHPYGWYHPFGFLFPLFFLFAFFFFARVLLWGPRRGGWHHGWYGGVPPAFDEWHRRAHEASPDGPKTGRDS